MLQPSPVKEISSRDWENTGRGLILGQDQGRHRVVKQKERKLCFIDYDLLTMLSLEYEATIIIETMSTSLTWKSCLLFRLFSKRVSINWLLENLDCSKMPTVSYFYRIGVYLLFSGKEETLGSELARNPPFPTWLLLLNGYSIAPCMTLLIVFG